MKRLWIGVGMMVVVAGLLIWGNVTTVRACDQMTAQIVQIVEQAEEQGDFAAAKKSAGELKEIWMHYHAPLSAIKHHDELHDLMININLIEKYTKEAELEDLIPACDDSLVRLEHLKDGEKVTFGNVF